MARKAGEVRPTKESERRRYRRLSLRLPVAATEGAWPALPSGDLWTSNISAGGMYFKVAGQDAPADGAVLSFELSVPPGEGYSSCEGTIRGAGRVVRTDQAGQSQTGVALRFTQPRMLEF